MTQQLSADGTVVEILQHAGNPFLTLRRLLEFRPAVVHVHNSLSRLLPALTYRATRRGVKVVFTFHTQPTFKSFLQDEAFKRDYSKLGALAAQGLLRQCDRVTTVSNTILLNLSEHYGITVRRPAVVPSGAWPCDARPGAPLSVREDFRREMQIEPGTFLIASLGVMSWDWKVAGHMLALRALKLLIARGRRAVLVIAGDGHRRWQVEREIESLGVGSHVRLVGNLNQPERLLQACDAYLHLGLNEGAPLSIAEAAMAGCPIVAANVGGLPELIEHEKTGLLTGCEPGEIAGWIDELMDRPDLREKLGRAARETALSAWTWERIAKQYDELYRA